MPAIAFLRLCLPQPAVYRTGAAVFRVVRIQDLLVFSLIRHPCGNLLWDSRKVRRHHQYLFRILSPSGVSQITVLSGHMVNPLKALRTVIQHGKLRPCTVQMVQIADQPGNPCMVFHLAQFPLYGAVLIPLVKLSQILSHEKQLLSGMGHHISIRKPQVRKFLFPFAGHFTEHGCLAVHHLVVGKYQHEMFRICVDHAESQFPMVMASEIRVILDILQVIVHKSHIPFQVEAQAIVLHRSRDLRECGAFLRNAEHAGITLFHDGIEMLDHLHGFQVLLAAIHIGNPFTVIFTIIQIQHACHRIHPDTIRMVFFHPEQSVGNQIVGHLGTTVIINQRTPVRMEPLPGIQVLIETCPVEIGHSIGIPGEMGGHPVQDHADPRLVQFIHEAHEILRRTVPRGRGIITDHLVSPGGVQGMLHHRHQFHMGIPHLLYIVDHLRRNLTVVGILFAQLRPDERTQVHLIHTDRGISFLEFFPVFQESCILPLETADIRHHGSRVGTKLRRVSVRICL